MQLLIHITCSAVNFANKRDIERRGNKKNKLLKFYYYFIGYCSHFNTSLFELLNKYIAGQPLTLTPIIDNKRDEYL